MLKVIDKVIFALLKECYDRLGTMDTDTWVASIIALLTDPNFVPFFCFQAMGKFIPRSPAHFRIVSGQTGKVYEYREIACGDWRWYRWNYSVCLLAPYYQFTIFSILYSIREGRMWKTHGHDSVTNRLYRASFLLLYSFWQYYICSQWTTSLRRTLSFWMVQTNRSDYMVMIVMPFPMKGFTTLNADTPVWVVC